VRSPASPGSVDGVAHLTGEQAERSQNCKPIINAKEGKLHAGSHAPEVRGQAKNAPAFEGECIVELALPCLVLSGARSTCRLRRPLVVGCNGDRNERTIPQRYGRRHAARSLKDLGAPSELFGVSPNYRHEVAQLW